VRTRAVPAVLSIALLFPACVVDPGDPADPGDDDVGAAEQALAGELDTGFGAGGTVRKDVSPGADDSARDVAIQSDGKILVVGAGFVTLGGTAVRTATLLRYNANGTLDSSFAQGGIATLTGATDANGIAIQPDGKIVIVGTAGEGIYVSRYNTNGTLDSSFGLSGTRTLSLNGGPNPIILFGENVTLQGDGKVVAVGRSNSVVSFTGEVIKPGHFVVLRLTASGAFDTSFDGDGFVALAWENRAANSLFAVKVDSSGRILGAGMTDSLSGTRRTEHIALVRWSSNGSLDNSFGTGGVRVTPIETFYSRINDIALQSDGKIVAAGHAFDLAQGTTLESVVLRYSSSGNLDPTFGNGGIFTSTFGTGAVANDLAFDSSGRIVFAGYRATGIGLGVTMSVARLKANGTLDTAFGGGDGIALANPGGVSSQAAGVAIQGDGKLVVAGPAVGSGNKLDHGLARFLIN